MFLAPTVLILKKHAFQKENPVFFSDENFRLDFANLYKYYKGTRFSKFAHIGENLFMVFQVGKSADDVKNF